MLQAAAQTISIFVLIYEDVVSLVIFVCDDMPYKYS